MLYKSLRADYSSYNSSIKSTSGKAMILVGTKTSRRVLRKGKTEYYYNLEGTNEIYYNQSKGGVWFSPVAFRVSGMKKFYELFCVEPLTGKEQEWLKLYPNLKLVL